MTELLGPRCGCDDCEAAVSPGAYLASLLDYVLKHVRNNGVKIDLAFLEARFHQPFAELPIDCEAMDKKVHLVRLAVEVLRGYLGERPLLEPTRETTLSSAEADYRLAAYTRLLTLLGTTYEEIRRARSAIVDDRKALAERLGIDLTPNPGGARQDELDRLLLEAALPATKGRALTEQTLERVFGLVDTGRDRLSEGTKHGDAQQQITRWNFNGAYWDRNTDAEGLIHLDLLKLAADRYAVRAFSDVKRSHVVASGERKTALGAIRLVPENGSGLSGIVEIDYKADETDISLSLVPSMLGWRLRHLRILWDHEDWPADPPVSETKEPLLPLIDPQVISISDLRSARPGDAAFDLWLARFNWLAGQRSALKAAREAAASQLAGMKTIVAQALSMPGHAVTVDNLNKIKEAQERGERIEQQLQPLGLTSGAFAFLMPILNLAGKGLVIDLEWEVVYDTLLRTRKQLEFADWRTKEKGLKLTLSPSHFRVGDNANAPEQAISLSVPFWLSTREVRRGWVNVLEARIKQEAAVAAGLESAVSSVEEITLPLLRDALLDAADAEGSSLPDRAEWLTQRLLIDFRMSGLQLTTRVAQAIETLQELLFSLRTGQLEQDTLLASAPLESIYAVAQGNIRIDLFGRSKDDVLWHRVWDGRWRSWRSLGSLPGAGISFRPSNPAVVAHANGRLDLVVRGSDRVLWHRRYEQGWSDWIRVDDNLKLVGNPAVITSGLDQLDVFALRIGDLQVMRRQYNGMNWTAWEATGITSSRSPAAASWAADHLDLILGRHAPDLFKPLHRWWDDVAWQDEPLDNVLSSEPAAASWGVNRLDVFQNLSGHLWQKTWDGAWQPWVDRDALPVGAPITGPQLEAAPSVYSHASETLDVFALRSGKVEASVWRRRFDAGVWSEWEVLPSDHLELDAFDFDAEWKWIGSYATWRSAMFVRLYPDNLLLPSLITHQTPAFRALVKQSRPTERLTPKDACELAQNYFNYLRDITSLEIEGTCQVSTNVPMMPMSDPCKMAMSVNKTLFYMFGRTETGDKIYWSVIDPADHSGYAQSFWANVQLGPKDGKAPAMKIVNIIGALPWLNRLQGQHYIYLFVDANGANGRKVLRVRLDLDHFEPNAAWIGELQTLEMGDVPGFPNSPIAMDLLTVVPVQSDSVSDPPRLAVQEHWTRNVYIRPLNATGDGWEGDWKTFRVTPRYRDEQFSPPDPDVDLKAALRVNRVNWVIYRSGQALRVFADIIGLVANDVGDPATFRGALPGAQIGSSIFVFYDDSGQITYREIKKDPGAGAQVPVPGTPFIAAPSLTNVVPHSGSFSNVLTFFVVPAKDGHHRYAYRCSGVAGELISSKKYDVVPVLGSSFNILTGESIKALQNRSISIKNDYQQNKVASASILTYLTEAYRHVPLQLALNLQSSGEYVAALDWFMTVYDYRAPQGERYIDYGLAIDAGLPETEVYHHAEDWLLDPLNPHAVALTRRYAYTRFTIASIIRCLNDFADSEFTYDTDESLVRARLLYTTALELCDVPELRQKLGTCDALIGELEIQPGMLVPPEVAAALGEIAEELTQGKVSRAPEALIILENIKALALSGKNWATILPQLYEMKKEALKAVPVSVKTGTTVAERPVMLAKAYSGLLTDSGIEKAVKLAGEIAVAEAFILIDEIKGTHL
jgi:hypothetical protein